MPRGNPVVDDRGDCPGAKLPRLAFAARRHAEAGRRCPTRCASPEVGAPAQCHRHALRRADRRRPAIARSIAAVRQGPEALALRASVPPGAVQCRALDVEAAASTWIRSQSVEYLPISAPACLASPGCGGASWRPLLRLCPARPESLDPLIVGLVAQRLQGVGKRSTKACASAGVNSRFHCATSPERTCPGIGAGGAAEQAVLPEAVPADSLLAASKPEKVEDLRPQRHRVIQPQPFVADLQAVGAVVPPVEHVLDGAAAGILQFEEVALEGLANAFSFCW